MKATFELTVDQKTGEPVINFRHHDRSNALEQKLLKIFVDGAKKNGLKLTNPSGHLEAGTTNSWEEYEIRVNVQGASEADMKAPAFAKWIAFSDWQFNRGDKRLLDRRKGNLLHGIILETKTIDEVFEIFNNEFHQLNP